MLVSFRMASCPWCRLPPACGHLHCIGLGHAEGQHYHRAHLVVHDLRERTAVRGGSRRVHDPSQNLGDRRRRNAYRTSGLVPRGKADSASTSSQTWHRPDRSISSGRASSRSLRAISPIPPRESQSSNA
jgi:hypothetical protein